MKKLFVLLFVSVVMLSGCGESAEEKREREWNEKVDAAKEHIEDALEDAIRESENLNQ